MGDPVEMILDSVVIPPAQGKQGQRGKVPVAQYLRELNRADLDLILNPQGAGVTGTFVQKMRHAHHTLAMLVAEGKDNAEIHLITGYNSAYVSKLKGDPAFKELLAYYRVQKEAQFVDAQKRLAHLGITCIEELQDRLLEDPEGFKHSEVMELARLCFDRSVAPVKNGLTQTQGGNLGPVNFNIKFVGGIPGAPQLPVIPDTLELEALPVSQGDEEAA